MKVNNITKAFTLDLIAVYINAIGAFFDLGQFGGVTLHGPAMGGTPWPGSALRAAVWLFTRPFGLSVRDRVKLCTLSRGELLKIGPIVNYAVKYLLCVVLLPFSFDIFALSKNISLFCPLDDLF